MTPSPTLTDRWRPERLSDIRGQDAVVEGLGAILRAPASRALLFTGDTGTGKTSAAIAFARELGVDVENEEFGGLYQVPSGEQTAETVRNLVRSLGHWPMTGSGWRVAIVNEADYTSPGAAHCWLDVLETLPPRTVVIFTTNAPEKMPARWRDRCERFDFQSSAMILRPVAERFIAEVWAAEGGAGKPPGLKDLGAIEDGALSFRRLLQRLGQYLRSGAPATPEDLMAKAREAGRRAALAS